MLVFKCSVVNIKLWLADSCEFSSSHSCNSSSTVIVLGYIATLAIVNQILILWRRSKNSANRQCGFREDISTHHSLKRKLVCFALESIH
jgi:hypothetical protein